MLLCPCAKEGPVPIIYSDSVAHTGEKDKSKNEVPVHRLVRSQSSVFSPIVQTDGKIPRIPRISA